MALRPDIRALLDRLEPVFTQRGFRRSALPEPGGGGFAYSKDITLDGGVPGVLAVEICPCPRFAENPGYAKVQAERAALPGGRSINAHRTPVAAPILVSFADPVDQVSAALVRAVTAARDACASWRPEPGVAPPRPGMAGTHRA